MTDVADRPETAPTEEQLLPMPDLARVDQRLPFLTVVETVVHAVPSGEPTEVACRYEVQLRTREQVYRREMTVDVGWRSLDLGWVGDRVSIVHLSNREGERYDVTPTEEQRADVEDRVIEIGVAVTEVGKDATQWDPPTSVIMPLMAIPPRESMRFRPVGAFDRLRVRCRRGSARVTVVAFPE